MFRKWISRLQLEILKRLPIRNLFDYATEWLIEQRRRPNSVEAQEAIHDVTRLEEACTRFLDKVQIR